MDVDVGKPAQPHGLSPATDTQSIPTLDGWIESLMDCKQLSENDVSRLCDRVSSGRRGQDAGVLTHLRRRHEKFSRKSRTYSQWYVGTAQVSGA
jgi:hypothetical protein